MSNRIVVSVAEDENEAWRNYMEDGHKVVDPLPLDRLSTGKEQGGVWRFFGVYDGHGGRKAMECLERRLHHLVAAELSSLSTHRDRLGDNFNVAVALKQAFHNADGELARLELSLSLWWLCLP
jgi:serine/threonine protein phosphatase PrpC